MFLLFHPFRFLPGVRLALPCIDAVPVIAKEKSRLTELASTMMLAIDYLGDFCCDFCEFGSIRPAVAQGNAMACELHTQMATDTTYRLGPGRPQSKRQTRLPGYAIPVF